MRFKQFFINMAKGAAIGVGAILPGVSGGVLCVIFGIYATMMRFLSHPIKAFAESYRVLLPVGIGGVIGFLGLARLVDILFKTSQASAIWLFIGLVLGTLPSLYRSAGEKGRTKGSWAALVLCFAAFLAWMVFISSGDTLNIQPSLFWWLICGLLWGIGMIVPGLSPSSFLIYLGLYQPMTAGIADLSFSVILPIMIGAGLCILLLARVVNSLYEKHYNILSHALLGIVAASTVAIIPLNADYSDVVIYALLFIAGFLFALGMGKLGEKHHA